MGWFVSSHSFKLIVLKCYHVAFRNSNILQTICIPEAALGRLYTCNLNFNKYYGIFKLTPDISMISLVEL